MGSYGTDEQYILYNGIYVFKLFLPDDGLHRLKIVVFIEINKVWDSCVCEVCILFHFNIILKSTGFALLSLT